MERLGKYPTCFACKEPIEWPDVCGKKVAPVHMVGAEHRVHLIEDVHYREIADEPASKVQVTDAQVPPSELDKP